MSFPGIPGIFIPDYSTLAAPRPGRQLRQSSNGLGQQPPRGSVSQGTTSSTPIEELPPFIRILNFSLLQTQNSDCYTTSKTFISTVGPLHFHAFSAKCPILGTGHHFVVYANPFEASDHEFTPTDGRAINSQIYCFKAPNFASGGYANANSAAAKDEFRNEYYNTALQELRVLLHPQLRDHENIISLFGLDFQEDYDDCAVAWPVLVMEYAEYGTLDTFQQDICSDAELARILLLDVARGIQVLHQCNIIHGDVKSENVLICRHSQRKYVARLADFGLSLINLDDVSKLNNYRLPGGTFLWKAPESDTDLSVQGLMQTDVYSFGLTAWRVFVNHQNPYTLIPPASLHLQSPAEINKTVTRAKALQTFPQLVLQTMDPHDAAQTYSRSLIEATLGSDPESRDLNKAISVLTQGEETVLAKLGTNQNYWDMEDPSLILGQLIEAYPHRLIPFTIKASILRSLWSGLETIFSSNSELARQAGWFLFLFASGPQFQALKKDDEECCQILIQLFPLYSTLCHAILARYHELCGKKPDILDPEWLEIAASNGSYYARESLRKWYPERFLQLMQCSLSFEPISTDSEEKTFLINCCRTGDYTGCKKLLNAGVSACPSQEGMASALHWLVSFQDEKHINDLVELLIGNGAVIDAWEGEEDDLTFGRVVGTPLHWAIWHRNIPLVLALTKVDIQPDVKHVDRAMYIAAVLHFYDVLEVLKDWTLSLKNSSTLNYDWHTTLLFAAESGFWELPRRLRNSDCNLPQALDRTLDLILTLQRPSTEDIKIMFYWAIHQNNAILLQYLFKRLDLDKRKDLLTKPNNENILTAVSMGFIEIFEIYIEKGLLSSRTEYGKEKWNPLQGCCITRQRNSTFVRRLIEIGCPVDGSGNTEDTSCTPFLIAVSGGLYQIATLLLEHGADKDYLLGWLGGSTVTMNLLQTWPDIPVSRLKFLLEEVPRLGFGHVSFWGWPGAGGNLLYSLSMSHWSAYASGYRLRETAKYILSQLADKTCLNRIDRLGATALRMACASGNLEICQALIEAGQDVNLALGFSPLRNAKDWVVQCRSRERAAIATRGGPGGERRLAQSLRIRAELTVKLLEANGAVDRGFFEAMNNTRAYLASGKWQRPSFETALELFSSVIDTSPRIESGTTPLHPTSKNNFRLHHGKKSIAQILLGNLGRILDQRNGQITQRAVPRYHPHNCYPWRSDFCVSEPRQDPNHPQLVRERLSDISRHPLSATTDYETIQCDSEIIVEPVERPLPQENELEARAQPGHHAEKLKIDQLFKLIQWLVMISLMLRWIYSTILEIFEELSSRMDRST